MGEAHRHQVERILSLAARMTNCQAREEFGSNLMEVARTVVRSSQG